MPNEKNGVWNQEEANQHHAFDYFLAKWIGTYLNKTEPLIDMGCGLGQYLKYFSDIGFKNLRGIEGARLSNFEHHNIYVHDLSKPQDLGFLGNVLCLEVGEHIPEEGLEAFLNNIVAPIQKGQRIILSWAVPGQEGIGHVSCRDNLWVIGQMAERGLELLTVDTQTARAAVSNHCAYFRETLMIFKR